MKSCASQQSWNVCLGRVGPVALLLEGQLADGHLSKSAGTFPSNVGGLFTRAVTSRGVGSS